MDASVTALAGLEALCEGAEQLWQCRLVLLLDLFERGKGVYMGSIIVLRNGLLFPNLRRFLIYLCEVHVLPFARVFFFLLNTWSRSEKEKLTYPEVGGGLNLGVQVSALSEGDHLYPILTTQKEKGHNMLNMNI